MQMSFCRVSLIQVLQTPGQRLQLMCQDRLLLHSTGFVKAGQKARGGPGASQEGGGAEGAGGEGAGKGA